MGKLFEQNSMKTGGPSKKGRPAVKDRQKGEGDMARVKKHLGKPKAAKGVKIKGLK